MLAFAVEEVGVHPNILEVSLLFQTSGTRVPKGKTHFRGRRQRCQGWLTDRWGPLVGFFSHLPHT